MSSAQTADQVAAVVLNWNRTQDTLTCVRSLASSDWPRVTTIVVDNGSQQPIETALRAQSPDVVLIRNAENLGFAGGMNVGIERGLQLGAEYILLVNNDTIVDPMMVTRLVEAARTHPDAGILTPLILDREAPQHVTSAGWAFDPRRGHPGRPAMAGEPAGEHLHGVREVDASSGEAMFVAAAATRDVGPLDEELFLRLEDIDWSLRMRAAGRRNYVVLDARLWHAGSASSGGEHSPLNAYYHTRNILIVCARHAPMGRVRALVRESEVVLANLIHARRGEKAGVNANAVLAGWRDYRLGRTGPRDRAR